MRISTEKVLKRFCTFETSASLWEQTLEKLFPLNLNGTNSKKTQPLMHKNIFST